MLFNSIQFLVFFPIVTLLYFILPSRFRWAILLAASCYFYMFFIPYYILILFFTIIIDYFAGIFLEKETRPLQKKYLLIISIAANLGILIFFKYYNFFIENLNSVFHLLGSQSNFDSLSIILPIGLSFHTFQAMSYTIEVYRGNQKAERHPGMYALYVMFYPQLVAGPIERPQNILHQLHEKHSFNKENLWGGLQQIIWGLFKKVVIADTMATLVNPYFNNVSNASGWELLLATYCFTIQIYCDFSGYSDIALGSARTMGIKLMQNFDAPYTSKSISEFWSRWHISLSTWFRDYLYIPLGGNRVNKSKWIRNLIIVFLVSGLWHGANWTYVTWGALHAFYLVFALTTVKLRSQIRSHLFKTESKIGKLWDVFITFHLVAFAWIFFRSNSIADAFIVVQKIADSFTNISQTMYSILSAFNLNYWLVTGALFYMFYREQTKAKHQGIAYAISILLMIILLGKSSQEQFIYFQF